MKTKTKIKAGSLTASHNESRVRDAAPGLKVKTNVKAGALNAYTASIANTSGPGRDGPAVAPFPHLKLIEATMITTELNSRTTPQRRSSGRPARGTRRTAPAIEGLEDRRLLSISITEFPIPTANSYPDAIAAGPDGNIWFTEPGQNQVARINPTTHVITEFPEPAGTGPLDSLVAAPDGFLYAIGRSSIIPTSDDPVSPVVQINPATGAMTTVLFISAATDNPGNIAVSPDGNLWFIELDGIGEINLTTGAENHYTNGPLFSPDTIAAGPDGAL